MRETINHPEHYGGKDNPYEAIKVIEAHNLNFNTGNAVKYILRAGKKGDKKEDIKKAIWYLKREAGIVDEPECSSPNIMDLLKFTEWTLEIDSPFRKIIQYPKVIGFYYASTDEKYTIAELFELWQEKYKKTIK
jgi:hypothetical protein